ncbi:MAG: protein kinase domain-containing protein [Limisphaerales bacterium]
MTTSNQREEAIVNGALQLPPAQRASYLASACAGDAVLRERVEELLEEREKAAAPAQAAPPPADARQTIVLSFPLAEKPGDRLGRYKLLQQIGEGGCGVVYMADQEEPVRRRVALKIIKLGMDTRNVIARFEAERQALAMMDHPNIAKVLDVGATDSGRPFFVMELVRGIKITEYCDQNNLSTRERLALFIQVCHAIQHAHQKGVIHRDIKPSNILVTLHDGMPVPKVIDFGIAKATDQRLTDKTLFTQFEQFIGTPAYMSPEQAEMSGLDIDTRSDIYSLGVLLYELLTGKTPFDSKELLQSGLDQMRRTIREREPERPSTRISTMLDADRTVAAKHQRLDSIKLIHLLRGDLDWIVMKALEKDRTRRYETANGLGADVQRYLSNEPIIARPPSNLYRFQKFVWRNKTVFAAVSAGMGALIVGLALSLYLFFQEREARKAAVKAEQEKSVLLERAQEAAALETQMRQHAELGAKYTQAGMLLNQGNYEEAEKIMNSASNHVSSASAIFTVLGRVHGYRGQWQAALTNYSKVVDLLPEDHFAYFVLAPLFLQVGDVDGYRNHRSRILRKFAGTSDPQIGERMTKACLLLPPSATELEGIRKWADVAVAAGPSHQAWAYFQFAKGFAEYRSGHFEEAARWLKQATEHEQGPDLTVEDGAVLALAQYQLKQTAEARATLAKATRIAESNLPKPDGHEFGDFWHDWIIEQVLMREAQTLIPK